MTSEAVRYRVSMPRPHTHLFEVEARFPPLDRLDAVLPVWTPGSYLVREYPRHVQDVSAVDAQGAVARCGAGGQAHLGGSPPTVGR